MIYLIFVVPPAKFRKLHKGTPSHIWNKILKQLLVQRCYPHLYVTASYIVYRSYVQKLNPYNRKLLYIEVEMFT
jgi:hypothetical protein